MTAWDRCLLRRAAGVGAVAAITTLIVVAATDAGGPWSMRLGMTAAIAPICGGLATVAALRVAEARGEIRALCAVGADPWSAARGAVIGGIGVGIVGPVMALAGLADLHALFPQEGAVRRWVVEEGGRAAVETTLGLRVGAGGVISMVAPRSPAARIPAGAMGFAAAAIAAAAIGIPVWLAVSGGSATRRIAVGTIALLVSIVGFRAVSAGLAPAATLLIAPLILLGDAALPRAPMGRRPA